MAAAAGGTRPTAAKGDVFDLVQHLEPGLSFGDVRQLLRALAGMVPSFPSELRAARRQPPRPRWPSVGAVAPALTAAAPPGATSTATAAAARRILRPAARHDLIREGPKGSAWFAHRDQEGRLSGIEMRGPRWRGFAAGGDKTLFRLPGGSRLPPRLAVVEAPIDALSLAALEGPRADTLYLATAGGMGPGTLPALDALLGPAASRTPRAGWSRPPTPIRRRPLCRSAWPSWRPPPACALSGCGRRAASRTGTTCWSAPECGQGEEPAGKARHRLSRGLARAMLGAC